MRLKLWVAALAAVAAGCDFDTSLTPQSVLAACDKALAEKDAKAAANECPFAEMWLAHVKPDSLQHAQALEKSADLLATVNFRAAGESYQKALDIRDKLADKSKEKLALIVKLANVQSAGGQWQAAETLLKKLVADMESGPDKDGPEFAEALNRLGVAQLQQKMYTNAEQSLYRAEGVLEDKSDEEIGGYMGEVYNNLGYLSDALGKSSEAENFYRKSITSHEAAKTPHYQSWYDALSNLALLLQKQSKWAEAEAYWKQTLQVAEKGFGQESLQYATSLNNLGLMALAGRNFPTAQKLFNDVVVIREKKLGLNNLLTAEAMQNLAVAFANQGKRQEAEVLLRQAAAVSLTLLGPNNAQTQQRWNLLASLQGGQPNKAEAGANKPAAGGKK